MNLNSKEGSAPLKCITARSIGSKIANLAVTTVLSENPFNPLHYVPMRRRRDAWGTISKAAFPAVFPDGSLAMKPPGLLRAEELVRQGYGLVVPVRHFSNNDLLMLTGFCHKQSDILDEREVYTPLAYHQYTRVAKRLLEYFGVRPLPIVTLETKKKRKNYDALGQELKLGEGSNYYKSAVIDLLNRGGILFVAPPTTRTPKHEPWRHIKPIEMLIEGTGDKVAFMSVGLDIQDKAVTDYEKYRGYNFRKTYIVNIGETLTKAELVQRAQERNISVDRCVADDMALLVRPEILGNAYKELREQRLSRS